MFPNFRYDAHRVGRINTTGYFAGGSLFSDWKRDSNRIEVSQSALSRATTQRTIGKHPGDAYRNPWTTNERATASE